MKSAMKRSLAMLLTVLMILSVCALSLQMVVLAATVSEDNQPCDCGDASAHSKEEPVPPTCVEWGYTWNKCSNTGKKWATDFVAPSGEHKFTVDKSVAATCTQEGSEGFFCEHCGEPSPNNTTTPALGHNFAFDITNNSCLEGGKAIVKCLNGCEEFKDGVETEIPATGHNHQLVEEEVLAPTCEEEGYITYKCVYCEKDDTKFAVFFKALGHMPNTEKIEPDCENPGYEIGGVCVRPNVDKFGQETEGKCHHVLDASKEIPATGHDWVNMTGEDTYKAPTCDEDGYQWQECSVCEKTQKDPIAALGHAWGTAADAGFEPVVVAPVCKPGESTDGYTLETCKVCEETRKINWVPATHNYKYDANATVRYTFAAAILDANGNKVLKLDESGKKTYFTVATIKCADGLSCEGCDKCEVYVCDDPTAFPGTAAEAANWIAVLWIVQEAPSCGTKGILVHSCKDCEFTESLHIPSAHIRDTSVTGVVHPATCTEEGYTVYKCAVCGEDYKDEYTAHKGGHLWTVDGTQVRLGFDENGDPIVYQLPAQSATCTEPGRVAADYCEDPTCELYLNYNPASSTEPPLGHDFTCDTADCQDCWKYYAPTCAHRGYWAKAHCHRCGAQDPSLSAEDYAFENAVKIDTETPKPAHVWDTEHPFTPGKDATCSEQGRTPVLRCVNCNGFTGGDYVAKLEHTNTVVEFEATCQSPAMKVTYCTHCATGTFDPAAYVKAADQAAYLNSLTTCHVAVVELTGKTSDNGGHWILDLPEDARVWDDTLDLGGGVIGGWRYDLSAVEGSHIIPGVTDLDNDGTPDYDAVTYPGQYVEGSCSSSYIQHHNAYYICGHCGELIEFSVVRIHGWKTGITGTGICGSNEVCNDCGETLTVAASHNYVSVVTAPTCTAQGYTTHTCSVCNHSYVDSYVAANGHSYVDTVTAPTCTTDGYTTHTCSVCNYSYTDTPVTALGHTWGAAATCLEAQKCTVCGVANPAAPALGHVWERAVDGKELNMDIQFIQCIATVVYDIDEVTGEITVSIQYNDIEMSREASCTEYGYVVYECSDCGHLIADHFEAAHGHDYQLVVESEGDCVTARVEYKKCTVCGDITDRVVTNPTPGCHMNVNGEEIFLDCVWLGTHTEEERFCIGCGVTFDAADYHDWNEEPIVTATCTEYGVQIYYCNKCDTKNILNGKDDIVAPLGHDKVLDTEKSVAATMTSTGTNYYKCSRCDLDMGSETVPALGGVMFTDKAVNGVREGALFVNNGLIAYTVSIEGLNAKFYSIWLNVEYDEDALTYIGYNLGDKAANIFGPQTQQTTTVTLPENTNGNVYVFGFNENNEHEVPVDVTLEGKQEFVTLYFRVNGNVRSDSVADADNYFAYIEIEETRVLDAAEQSVTTDYDESCGELEIWKLGDVTDEHILGTEDDLQIAALAKKDQENIANYDARADIDQNGIVDAFDLIYIRQYLVQNYTYADLFDLALDPTNILA